ncbi:hypothetical protein A4X13_0g277 [Tilletia indica]|uniref:Pentacotripeptide-repeat region of PRORP domain-containing protein n=1 Tax=Tilletia indica TaxID=43049 RepID=A0A177TKT4_9BASI|nr:hypothetical protein A4X13_0g277 [Tilletia indica]
MSTKLAVQIDDQRATALLSSAFTGDFDQALSNTSSQDGHPSSRLSDGSPLSSKEELMPLEKSTLSATTGSADLSSKSVASQQAYSRYSRAFKEVRSQMLITSSTLEATDEDRSGSDFSPTGGRTYAKHPLQAETPPLTPLPLRAHARFRAAFSRMRNQMLITSRVLETGSADRNSLGHLLVPPKARLAGIVETPTTSTFTTLVNVSPPPEAIPFPSEKPSLSPDAGVFFDLSRHRRSSLASTMTDNASQLQGDGFIEEEPRRRNSLAGLPNLSVHDTGLPIAMLLRRSSIADAPVSRESHLREELRTLLERVRSSSTEDNVSNEDSSLSSAQSALIHATVRRYDQDLPMSSKTGEGWDLCLEALYAVRQHSTPEAATYDVLGLFDRMTASGIRPKAKTYTIVVQSLCAAAAQLHALDNDRSQEADAKAAKERSAVSLLERALHTLRIAVIQHPSSGTHPSTAEPFVMLLNAFATHALPERAEQALQLWARSAAEAGLHKPDGRAHHAIIQAAFNAAEKEGGLMKIQLPDGQEHTAARSNAVQIITDTLHSFEQDCNECSLALAPDQAANEEPRAAFDLLVYNSSVKACFHLGYPDRALEIFERILSHRQVSTNRVSQVPVDGSTINVLLEGLLHVGEPATAAKWLLKLRQHNQLVKLANTSPGEIEAKVLPEPTDLIVRKTLEALVNTLPPIPFQATRISSEVETILQGLLDLLPVVRERTEASATVLPKELAARVDTILSCSPRPVAQATSGSNEQLQVPAASQPMTPSHTDKGCFPSQHVGPQALPSPPTTPPPVTQSSTRSNSSGFNLVDPSCMVPLNVKIQDLPALRKIDAGLGRRLESLLRPKKGRDESTFVNIKGSMTVLRKQMGNGLYPDAAALKELLMAGGRASNLQQVREVYAIASVVIAAMEPGSEAQSCAWYSIEDSALSALAHAGDTATANAHRHRLLAAGQVPSANAYAALIATVKDTTDDAQAARNLFEESRRLGVVPNVYLFNAIISKLSRARKAYPALQLFDEMQRQPHNFRPTSVTYGAIVNACVRGGDTQRAARYFAELEADPSFKPRVPPYNTMIQHFTYAEPDRKQALFYYMKMQCAGVQPSAHTYKLLLDIHGTIKPVQPREMELIFEKLRSDPGVEINGAHWASLIQGYGMQLHDLDKAIEIFHRAQSSGNQDPVALEALMLVFFEARQPALMRQYAEHAMQSPATRLTAYICNLLIKGYALDGFFGLKAARAIFEQMQDPPAGVAAVGNHAPRVHGAGANKTRPGARVNSVSGQGSNAPRRGRQTYEAAQEPRGPRTGAGPIGAASLDRIYREPSTYESMIRAELAHGNLQMAQRVFKMMETRGFPSALLSRTRTLFDEPRHSVLTVVIGFKDGAATATS